MSERLPAPGSRLPGLIDLASARVGGRALAANDEFFAPKSNLLLPGRGVFIEGKYTDRGKWMDGWETRRRRTPGHDWCVVRLGIAGVIRGLTVDTNHFRGNYPESCSVEGAAVLGARKNPRWDRVPWSEVLPRTPLQGHAENEFTVANGGRFTHVRLNIFPDGGVARLRVWGEARPDWARIGGRRVNLAAVELGAAPLAASDQFFSDPLNLLLPGRPVNMGDGWETKRRRGPGNDWAVVRLGARGVVDQAVVDTTHFKGNYPDSCIVLGCDAPQLGPTDVPGDRAGWRELVPRTKLRANAAHRFRVTDARPVTHVSLSIYPDGGVARLRVMGRQVG